jgi:uncharacterized radical SAM superfamily Fe-S cluster-containing enzyme
MSHKVDRDEVFLELTRSICPICKDVIDAEVNMRDDKVFLRKRCRDHGEFEALLYGDADLYLRSLPYNKPGTYPAEHQTEVRHGCPLDCGLCPEHKQHACVGLIEVNTACNLDCPVCFADSGHQPDGFSLSHDQVAAGLAAFVASEGGEPEMLMYSGGEPTIHPHLLDFVDMAHDAGVKHVIVNTNGIKLANNLAYCRELARRRAGIYLQFDGFDERTHLEIRGRDLREVKQRALDHCAQAGLSVMVTAAVEKGLNDHEMGDIVRFAIGHPAVKGVVFQPVTHAGRMIEFDPADRMTNSDVIHGLAAQVPEWFRADDFFPVPCCFPTCRSVSYCLVDGVPGAGSGGNGGGSEDGSGAGPSVLPLIRLLDPAQHLDYVGNRVFPDAELRSALELLFSASASPDHQTTIAQMECASCGIDMPALLPQIEDKLFMITIQDFQDPYTLNVKSLMKCCVEQITPDGRLIPFCAYNSVGYREQVREQLSGTAIHDYVPNASPISDQLTATVYGSLARPDDPVLAGRRGGDDGEGENIDGNGATSGNGNKVSDGDQTGKGVPVSLGRHQPGRQGNVGRSLR